MEANNRVAPRTLPGCPYDWPCVPKVARGRARAWETPPVRAGLEGNVQALWALAAAEKGLPPPLEPTGAHRNPATETQAEMRTPTCSPGTTPNPDPASPLSPRRPLHRDPAPEPAKNASDHGRAGRGPGPKWPPRPRALRDPGRSAGFPTAWSLAGEQRARARGHSHSGLSRGGERQREGPSRLQRVARARGKGPAELHFPGGPGTRSVGLRWNASRSWRKQKNNSNTFMENR